MFSDDHAAMFSFQAVHDLREPVLDVRERHLLSCGHSYKYSYVLLSLLVNGRPHLPRVERSVSEALAEEHPPEAVVLGSVGLHVAVARVVSEVLGHGFVGVEPDLAEMQAACLVFRQAQQTAPDAASLSGWQDSHILQQQMAGPGDEDGEADSPAAVYLWVPKTCVTWADALQIAVGSVPRSDAGRPGLGPSGAAMIYDLWA